MLCLLAAPANAGHRLEVGVSLAHLDFDEEIRFENDLVYAVHGAAELTPGWTLGVEVGRVNTRDRLTGGLQDLSILAIRTRYAPLQDHEWSPLAGAGVNFTLFEDAPRLDSISEGFEFALGGEWRFAPGWVLRGEGWLRLQTINRFEVDESGVPTGSPEETGYLWSKLLSLGVNRAF